jgi:trigger factor
VKVTTEKPEPGVATLTVEVPPEELDRARDQAWRRLANRVNIPGFRRGKAPRPLVERQVGAAAIDEEALRRLLPERYDAAVDEAQIKPIERPQFDVVQLEQGQPLIFKATVALRPTVDLGDYQSIQIEPETAEVADEQVARVMDRLREDQAQWVPVEDGGLEQGDMAIADLQIELQGEGERQSRTTERKDAEIILGEHGFPQGFDEQMLGARAGETREFPLSWQLPAPQAPPAEGEVSDATGGERESQPAPEPPEPERRTSTFTVHVKDIKRKQLPALDDEFAKSIGDHGTMADLERDVRRRLYLEALQGARAATENKAVEAAVQGAAYEIPARLIEAETEALVQERRRALEEQRLTLERYLQLIGRPIEAWREEMRERATQQLRARLLLDQLAETEQLAATPHEVEQEIERTAEAYGEQAARVRRSLMTDEGRRRISANLRRQKAIARLVEVAGGYPQARREELEDAGPGTEAEASDTPAESQAGGQAESQAARADGGGPAAVPAEARGAASGS